MKKYTALAVSLLLPITVLASEQFPDDWLTVAERTDFRATSSYDETMSFLRKVEAAAPEKIQVTDFGRSGQGRPLPLVIVSSEGAFTPEAAAATGKPVLLMESCIHAGEVDGKDAGNIHRVLVPPETSPAANHAFDVTPSRLVSGFITERGVCGADEKEVCRLFPDKCRTQNQ